jgi:hypothetical protein
MSQALTTTGADAGDIMERVIAAGDLSKLTPTDRTRYYNAVCQSVGLNPFTRPFEYLALNGKLVLYARKDATEQLRRINQISIRKLEKEQEGDLYIVTAYARAPDGREDMDMGAVSTKGLAGDALVNARLKAVTKAKRRVTLSICGLGFLDETEVETIPGARMLPIKQAAQTSALPSEKLAPEEERKALVAQVEELCAALNSAGYTPRWTRITLATYVNDKFLATDGLDSLSFEKLRELISDLSLKLDAELGRADESPDAAQGTPEPLDDEQVF